MATTSPPSQPPPPRHPLAWLLVFGLLGWTLFVTLTVQGGALMAAWSSQLSKTAASAQQLLAYGLLQPALVIVPGLPLLLLRGRRQRAVVGAILLASFAAGLLILPRALLAPDQTYAAGLARAGIAGLFGLILLVWASASGRASWAPGRGLPPALLLAALFLLPWLLYGALGDGLDTLVAAAQALGLALLAAGLAAGLMPQLADSTSAPTANIWLGGVTLAVALVAIAGAWGQMDYQALLLPSLPALAFPLAWLGARSGRYDFWSAFLLVFLAACGPLAFADPRETSLISILSSDTAVWTEKAASRDLLLGVIVALVLGISAARLRAQAHTVLWSALAGVGWVGAIAVYFLVGQPGWYGDDFFVVMKDQADLTPAAAITDVDARRAWVYETLVKQADASQLDLLTWLDRQHIPYTRYYLVDGLEVHANALRRWQISRRADIDRILYSPALRPLPAPIPLEPGDPEKPAAPPWGVEAIGAPRVWQEFGVTGEGIVGGQSDSGVDGDHPALSPTYRGKKGGDDYNWFDPWNATPRPTDASGHGTHTLGTVLGQDGIGVAPGATWFGCVNLARNLGNTANYLDCMQFMLAPHPQRGDPLHEGRPDLAADISTNSWGCPPAVEGCDQLTLWQAAQALRAAGIFFVAAAGNEGPGCDSLQTPPGNYGNVLSVGALDPDRNMASFSNRGPLTLAPDASTGPDVLAPGVDVISAWPGGTWATQSGTSMAAPHVAGVVALMWSANPSLRGNIDATERILQETAAFYTGAPDDCGTGGETPDSGAGYGVVDAYAAVKRALETK